MLRLVPMGLAWLLGVQALQQASQGHLKSDHRCVSKDPAVTDAYCQKVKCDKRFAQYCVWFDSPEAVAVLSARQTEARNGMGAQDALNTLVAPVAGAHSSPPPDKNPEVDAVQQSGVENAPKAAFEVCWVATSWYPRHECGTPIASECKRGFGVFASQEECCKPGASFTHGCDGYTAPLKLKSSIISEVLRGDPRVAKDEAKWVSELSHLKLKREAMLRFGADGSGAPEFHAARPNPQGGGVIEKPGVPPTEGEKVPQRIPLPEPELIPLENPQGQLLHQHVGTRAGVYFSVIGQSSVPALLSKAQFDKMFPYANFHSEPGIYSYENLVKATTYFPAFAGVGDAPSRKRELAAFLAHVSQETSGWWEGQEYVWGLTYNREAACGEARSSCDIYPACSAAGSLGAKFPCAPGQRYYGRGPMMLAWNYNYGDCSQYLFGDNRLLVDPDLVARDGVTAFMTALWFWMEPHGGFDKPSSHDAITGLWRPSGQDVIANRKPGFGLTLNIANGKATCLKQEIPADGAQRIAYYTRYCQVLGVSVGSHANCKAQIPFVVDFNTPFETYPESRPDEAKLANSAKHIMTMGDKSLHLPVTYKTHTAHATPPASLAAYPAAVAPFDKYKFIQSGRKCGEDARVLVECGDCGPNLTDLESCRAMCDAHLKCRYFSYFNDKSCRLYTSCAPQKTELSLPSTIYFKQTRPSKLAPHPAATYPAVGARHPWGGSQAVHVPVSLAKLKAKVNKKHPAAQKPH